MKVTHVSVSPTPLASDAGCPSLTPELLAAVGARYSRNGEGLDAILSKVAGMDPDRAVDTIFANLDYGHQSIADIVPIAMFMDDISVFLAYYLWSECSLAGGQETSTRYVKMDRSGVLPFEKTGLPPEAQQEWYQFVDASFDAYNSALQHWTSIAEKSPHKTRIPAELLEDPSEKAKKQVDRMRRNYAFDRARYFLPVAALTNVMMIQPAREWARLIGVLMSIEIPEFQELGGLLRSRLELSAPRLVKHAVRRADTASAIADEWRSWRTFRPSMKSGDYLPDYGMFCHENAAMCSMEPRAYIELFPVDRELGFTGYPAAMQHRTNRYSRMGSSMARTGVRVSWDAVSMAEIRDLNRHRPGSKFCPLSPQGFYCALEQAKEDDRMDMFGDLEDFGWQSAVRASRLMWDGNSGYMFWTTLGTQFYFEHTNTLDKFVYEAELRTGTGAHFRYAKHLHDALGQLYKELPELRGIVLEGSAEPE